jgi:hypothetical protein
VRKEARNGNEQGKANDFALVRGLKNVSRHLADARERRVVKRRMRSRARRIRQMHAQIGLPDAANRSLAVQSLGAEFALIGL